MDQDTAAELCERAQVLIAESTGVEEVDIAIGLLRRAIPAAPDPGYAWSLLAAALEVRWEFTEEGLDACVEALRGLVGVLGAGDERRPAADAWLGYRLADRFLLTGDQDDGREALLSLDGLLPRLAEIEDAYLVPWTLGQVLLERSQGKPSRELDEAARVLEQAQTLSPEDDRPLVTEHLVVALVQQWLTQDDRVALDRMIECLRELPERSMQLGMALGDRHAVTGSEEDRNEAIGLLAKADDDAARKVLAQLLYSRALGIPLPSSPVLSTDQAFAIAGNLEGGRADLEAALPLAARAARSPHLADDDRADAKIMEATLRRLLSGAPDIGSLSAELDGDGGLLSAQLAVADAERERSAGRLPDIDALTRALPALPGEHAVRPLLLAELGLALGFRGTRDADRDDLARAAAHLEEALGLIGDDHPLRGQVLLYLAMALFGLLNTDPTGVPYESVIRHVQRAESTPHTEAVWGLALLVRASVLGTDDDDAEAIAHLRNASGGPLDGVVAAAIGTRLAWRAETRGDLAAMDAAEHYLLAAEHADLPSLPACALRTMRAGNRLLRARFHGDVDDADEAIRVLESDLAALSTADPWHPRVERMLGESWLVRGRLREAGADVLRGLGHVVRAHATAPADHPDHDQLLSGAALAQAAVADLTGDRAALDSAIALLTDALNGTAFLHGERVTALRQLAQALHAAGHPGQAVTYLEEAAAELAHDAGNQATPHVLHRLATWYRERGDARAPATGLAALRAHASQVLLQSGTERALAAARAAAETGWEVAAWSLEDGDPDGAVAAIEHGRALVLHAATTAAGLGTLLRERGEAALADAWDDALTRQGDDLWREPDAADRLLAMRGRWEIPSDVRRRALAALGPLLPPPPVVSDLHEALRAADKDALVYLLPDARSALLVRDGEPTHALGLPAEPRPGPLSEKTLGDLCEWAWRTVVAPLFQTTTPWGLGRPPNLVLVPCGDLATVPWHAARVRTGAGRLRYAIEDAVFTYAASGGQFAHAATRRGRAERVALIADPDGSLPTSLFEAEQIQELIHPDAELLSGSRATPEAVLARLPGATPASVLHLGCHGKAAASPSDSHLKLAGGDLPVSAVLDQARAHRADDGGLVVLAACTSDLAEADHDEALTLATAFLAAGSTGVTGTRWAVYSDPTALVMVMFHHFLRDVGDPARALRAAQLWMLDPARAVPPGLDPELADIADETPEDPYLWAAFTHHGR